MEELKKLNELNSLQNQVQEVRSQYKLGKQNYHQKKEKFFEPITDTRKTTTEKLTNAITGSFDNNKTIAILNKKLSEIMNDRGIKTSNLLSPLSKINNPEKTTQFKLVKYSTSNRVNDFKIQDSRPIILHDNLLTFRDTGKVFELKGDILEVITNKNYNVDFAKRSDKKLLCNFAKEMNFDLKATDKKSTRGRTLLKILKSPSLLVSASGVSNIKILTSDPNDLYDRIKILLTEEQAGNNSDLINKEIVAIVDKLLEYKCISKKQHKKLLIKSNLLH